MNTDHVMIRVSSSAAASEGNVRRMCVDPGCDYVETLEPDSEELVWKNRNYGKVYR